LTSQYFVGEISDADSQASASTRISARLRAYPAGGEVVLPIDAYVSALP
jgi:hypothetical protein